MVTDDELRQIMPTLPAARRAELLPAMQQAMNEFGINNKLREAAFLATLAVESGELRLMVENLNYSAQGLLRTFPKYFTPALANAYARQPEKIANRVYANRMGNGPEASGDGWRYRGRGVIQITGRDNYRRHGGAIGVDIENSPERAADPDVAFRIAGAFWQSNGCNPLADQQNFGRVSKIINGRFPPHGWPERQRYYAKAKQVLSSGDQTVSAAAPAGAAGGPMRSGAARPGAMRSGAGRPVPSGLSRGIYPGQEHGAEGPGEGVAEAGAKKSAKKSGAKSGAKKAGAKKAAGKKSGAKKAAAGKGAAKKAGAKKAGSKKGGAGKGAAKKAGAGRGAASAKKAGAKKRR